MCGINALFDPANKIADKPRLVAHMNDQMVYRGPDDEGVYTDAHVALGMRRLSIIDLAGGHQPLYNEDRSLVLVCNGEIYNYVELIRDLKARGHQFMSGSDTEAILHLYEEKNERCLEEMRGMFAFVLWDTKRQRLFAARDRIGIKPLYISQQNGGLWLSSELKAIVGAQRAAPTLRTTAVYQFLLYGYAFDQRHTVIEEVQRLLPGEYLLADANGVSFKRYWQPGFGGENGCAHRSDAEILSKLEEAVALHLRSDVPVGILLSSGIDSSAVAAFAARSRGEYNALCAGYAGRHTVDERSRAHRTAERLGLHYHDVVIDETEYSRHFDSVVGFCDEPVGDLAAMPQWALYERARQLGYKVVLSGIGGDEIFFGYGPWNTMAANARTLPAQVRCDWIGLNCHPSVQADWQLLQNLAANGALPSLAEINMPARMLRDQAEWGPDAMASILFGTYLVHNGCFLADKLGMGCSVEVRVPFLDHLLVENVIGLPLDRRFSLTINKPLLRHIMQGWLDDEVLNAPKRGFTPPSRHNVSLVLERKESLLYGVLAQELLDQKQLRILLEKAERMSWLRLGRIRKQLGIDIPRDLLFRMLAFEGWYAHIRKTLRRAQYQ
jgi:asparagine synthase (glutamine-hydrolysing)